MPWEVTDTSTAAAVGFGAGSGNSTVLQGSNRAGLNEVVANHHNRFNQNLAPVPPHPVPEPQTYVLMLVDLGVLGNLVRRRQAASAVGCPHPLFREVREVLLIATLLKTLRQKNLWASFGSGSLPST